MSISKGSVSDPSHLLGRVSRIEALLSQFQVLEVVADIFGRGRWRMDALVRPSSTEIADGAASGRLVLAGGSAANKLRVTSGTVNAEIPTLGGTALNASTPPEITVAGDVWVWLKVVGVFSGPTYTVTVETSGSSSTPSGTAISATGFTSYRLIGSATLTDGAAVILDNRNGGDLSVDSFGSANFWWLS